MKKISLVNDTINREDIRALINWLNKDPIPRLTKGELTLQLESQWAKKIGTKYAVYVNSGSSAILLALAALLQSGKLKNRKIVVPGLSWATDVSSPMLLGMQPILCDCNLNDLSCDLKHLEEIFKKESPAVLILVSPLGLVPEMKKTADLCKKHNVILLEDVCESMGSKYRDKYLGTTGLASFFSLYFGHHLSTIEGGFINTNNKDFYHLLLMMRSHGWDRDLPKQKQLELRKKYSIDNFSALYSFYVPGFNLRATDLQAFLGLHAIKKLDKYSIRRNNNFFLYLNGIKNNLLHIKVDSQNFISSFAFPVVTKSKEKIIKELIENNIEVRPLIAGDMSQKPLWLEKYGKISLPNCRLIEDYGFYLPNHQDLKKNDILTIIKIINKYE